MKLEEINTLTRRAYECTALKYHLNFKDEIEQKEFDRNVLEKFSGNTGNGSYILDAGCGPSGNYLSYFYKRGHKVTGIDISPKCISVAKENNPAFDFREMDMMSTEFNPSIFDGIISYYSIIYTPKEYAGKIFSEFRRILKPGGKLLVVVKKGELEGLIDEPWYEGNKVYFSLFTEEEIENYFRANNFSVDTIETRKPYDFEINIERIYCTGTLLE